MANFITRQSVASVALVALLACAAAHADTVQLKPDRPERHVVVKGDTLWDIAAQFLNDPWLWPEIWEINPEIRNPHLIYPGDIIRLVYVDGKPRLLVEREGAQSEAPARPTVKLAPQARISKLEGAIPTIPIDALEQFLKFPRIVSEAELDSAPYIVASTEGHLISGAPDKIYVRGLQDDTIRQFDVVRRGSVYRDPANRKEILGYEAHHIADAQLTAFGDPSTFQITEAKREVLIGDLVMPTAEEEEIAQHFLPHAPGAPVEAEIISVLDGVSRIGQYHTVVLNKGYHDKFEVGHVLAVYQTGDVVRDTISPKRGRQVKLPNERAGTIMIVRLFERVSYALVMEATRAMRVRDAVTNP